MGSSSEERDGTRERTATSGVDLYARDDDSGPRFGEQTTCDLCENTRLCHVRYGLTACRDCHHELLPGGGVR